MIAVPSPDPLWLPKLIELNDFGGVWGDLLEAAYQRFFNDMVARPVRFRGIPVQVRRHPASHGKEWGFWHCVQEGSLDASRTPDLARCARIGWIRAIIENCGDPLIDHWTNVRGSERCHLLWFREEFLVVLAERGERGCQPRYMLLKTGYCTDRAHTCRKLRRDRDECH